MTDKRIALSTAGSKEEARKIAHVLVEHGLAACVNVVGPVESVYRWQGKVDSAAEYLLVMKTTDASVHALETALRELHSYELPEFVVLGIDGGSEKYLEWIAENA